MAFDVNNMADLVTLRDEVANDPITMGYAALPQTDTKKLLNALNDSDSNIGAETAGPIFSNAVLMDTWTPKGALNEMLPWIQALLNIQGDITQYEARYRANCGSDSLSNINAVIVQLSRAEVLFGQGTVITESDWLTARDYSGS